MSYQTKKNNIENVPKNIEKYSKVISEIEKFIEKEKKKPTTFKGIVEDVNLGNNILTIKLTEQLNLSKNSSILIKEDNPSGSKNINANIKDIYNFNLKIEIKSDPSQFENKNVIIDINRMNIILERLTNIVKNIKKGKLNQRGGRILDFLIGIEKPQYNRKKVSFISKEINENQKEAVIKSIEAEDFHLIIGPPGTGKTYVIEELIRQFLKEKQKKVLVTAWTNLAVDNIIKRLPKKETKNIVRIGPLKEIDSEVKKYSIFEKMKKHKDWKEVEQYQKTISEFFEIIPKVKKEKSLAQEGINQTKDKVKSLKEELDNLIIEKEKYKARISIEVDNKRIVNISSIKNEMDLINRKSEDYLSLSKNILQMNNLQIKIPKVEYIKNLKKLTRKMKISIIGKKISSFFSSLNIKEYEKLKKEYGKNKKDLNEIYELQKKYNDLKKSNENKFNKIYPKGNGFPDEDALNLEFNIYQILENQYLPSLKEQERLNTKKSIFEINQEVYRIYVDSLNRKIDLIEGEIKILNTNLYIQITHKNNLHERYVNLICSLDFYKKKVDKLKKDIISEIINKADLIATTAISSCHYFLDDTDFDVMIMDEASQVASFMSLLPLSKCKKFILVGDNNQLQPIEEKNISKEMNLSIFNRLFEKYPCASTFLSTQYRMHKTIAQIANEIFYEGKLKTSEKVAEKILSLKTSKHQFLNPKIPVVFIDTSKTKYYEDEVGHGCSNIKEAEYVAHITSLFIKKGIKTEDIGIVTPYVKQKDLIKEFLKNIKIKNVEVDTVHKFQGREKDIIIISFAKSKKYSFQQYELKFIENKTLINVSITRAKKKLILVGNSKTLCQSKLLNNVFNKIGKENIINL